VQKITFATLKKYAKQNKLFHCKKGQFSGMVDGMEWNIYNKEYKQTTLKDLSNFKVSKNYISINEDNSIKLTNCCYNINFIIK
tara:strand:+ start:591 stop:839 length:249 start_codon:yes stop_codon:yes gene_type:complete